MTTFSQLVDSIILECRRPDLASEIVSYVNQTIRELHFAPQTGNAILYRSNLIEDQLTATTDDSYSWTIPRPQIFQCPAAAMYPGVYDGGEAVYPVERVPGRNLRGQSFYYYRAGNYISFVGYGRVDSKINFAWYEYPKRLKYQMASEREATWDDESGWTYADPQPADEDEEVLIQARVTNWLLLRWADVVAEGIRAKVYKRVADEVRARTSYSLYSQLRQGLFTSESTTQDGIY